MTVWPRLLVLTACALLSAASASTPSVDPASKTRVDERVAAVRMQDRGFGPPDAPQPRNLAVGQWARYRHVDKDMRPSIITHKIVGQEGSAFWLETENDSYYGDSVTKMLLDFGDRKNLESFQVHRLIVRDKEGKVMELPQENMAMFKGMWAQIVSNMVIEWTDLPQEDVTAPAGTFAQCYKGKSKVSFMGFSSESQGWWHSDVPIGGTVKSSGIDHEHTMELVDFGTSGAESILPTPPLAGAVAPAAAE